LRTHSLTGLGEKIDIRLLTRAVLLRCGLPAWPTLRVGWTR
jgi:hypothetical protein